MMYDVSNFSDSLDANLDFYSIAFPGDNCSPKTGEIIPKKPSYVTTYVLSRYHKETRKKHYWVRGLETPYVPQCSQAYQFSDKTKALSMLKYIKKEVEPDISSYYVYEIIPHREKIENADKLALS